MSIRETLNSNRFLGAGIGVGVILLASTLIASHFFSGGAPSNIKVFFSDDDGKTWFAGDIRQVAPYDQEGKMAYRAHVFRCGDGRLFVNHLEALPDELRAQFEAEQAKMPEMELVNHVRAFADSFLVKKPGAEKWVALTPATKAAYSSIVTPVCPDGSKNNLAEVAP